MNFIDRMRFLFAGGGSKVSQARIVAQLQQVGQAQSTPVDYESLSRKGYSKNSAVYTAINKIATAGKSINWKLYTSKGNAKPTQVLDSPLITLFERPNPMQGQASFIEAVLGYMLISGNSYIEKNKPFEGKPPTELWPCRPDRTRIIAGKNGYPAAYEFLGAGRNRLYPVDTVKLTSDMLHWKTFNPLNDWYGLSPLQAAILSLDVNNSVKQYGFNLLKNGATPSGVLQMLKSEANPRGELTDKQFARLKAEFEENYQGSRNAGKPMLLEGGLAWQSISLSPREMDFLKTTEISAVEIFQVFGVPAELVGLGQKTFNNYREAKLSFYEETVLPALDSLRDDVLNKDVCPEFGEGLWLDYDKDDIEALSLRREQKYTSISGLNFLTQNEKREMTGKEKVDGWDVFVIGNQMGALPEDFTGGAADEEVPDPTDPDVDSEEETDDEPGKKPVKPDPADEDEEDDKGWKSINLVNANEKRQAYKRINRKRDQLAASFKREVQEDFKDMAGVIARASKLVEEPKLKEFAILNAVDQWMPNLERTLKRHIRYTLEDFGSMILRDGKNLGLVTETKAKRSRDKYDSFVDAYVRDHTATQITEIQGTTAKQVRRIVQEWVSEAVTEGDSADDLSKYLQAEFEGLSEARARTIAITEVGMASSNGSLGAAKALGVPLEKEWVSADDMRVREDDQVANHAVMNGKTIPIDEKFTVPPDASMDCPGDPTAGASQVCNCRCVAIYKSINQGQL